MSACIEHLAREAVARPSRTAASPYRGHGQAFRAGMSAR
jgi:hypothetical protein